MKNSEIHNGLDKKEIRDFLSQTLVKFMEEQFENAQSVPIPHHDDIYEYSIQKTEQDIKYHTKQLQIYKGMQATIQLIKMNGWQEFDVSDETEKDTKHILKMNFIGTEKEYDFLLLQINGD
jgi:adenine C2-methylase RlmN of 23S rRNA A2503 and tRNA A37